MTTDKTLFQIDIHFDAHSNASEMQALADELIQRGHAVNIKRFPPHGNLVNEITKSAKESAKEIKELADNVRGAAESGMQILRDMAGSFVKSTDTSTKPAENTEKQEKTTENPNTPFETVGAFDDIGPAAAAAHRAASNQAVVVTCPEALTDTALNAMRIGLLPKTALDRTWQPADLDAIVIPHAAFRPYLETIHWNPEHIFEGGYVALPENCPTKSREDAQKHFQLKREAGPIVLIMANQIPNHELQPLMIQLSLLKMPMQVFFYHAGDNYKAEQLRGFAQKFAVNARMFGRVNALPEYLAMADIAVAHVTDENIERLQNAAVPTVIIANKDVPAHVNFLSHERAALIIADVYKLSAALAHPLNDPNALTQLQTAATNVAAYASIKKCADAIEAALAKKNQIIPDPTQRLASADGFEVIGTQINPQNFITPQFQTSSSFETVTPTPSATLQPTTLAPAVMQPTLAPTHANGAVQPPPQILTPGLGARSKEDIKAEYSKLILVEKSLNKSLDAASTEVRKWEERLDLARQANRDDLITSAIAQLQTAQAQEMSLFQQKDQIQQQKALLKQSARLAGAQTTTDNNAISMSQLENELFGPSAEELAMEKEFLKLQKEGALQRLKDKLGK